VADRFHPRVMALAVLVAIGIAGCGSGAASVRATTVPPPPPSVDDFSASIQTPAPPSGAPGAVAPAPQASLPASTAPGGVPATAPSAGAPGRVTARTIPGVSDGASALPPSSTVAAAGRCRMSGLRLEPVDLQGSPGGTYADFRLVNTSSATCAVRGYVGARLIADSGRDLATTVRQEAGPNVWVQVVRQGAAQFHLHFANAMSGTTPCNPPNAGSVRVSLAGLAGTLTAPTPEGGIQACNGALSTAPVGST
jgi:hypothetical protein